MPTQRAIPAAYMRGGTSRALIFKQRDLPADRDRWNAIFAAALGSPDPGGRQLDGLGGGISSLSKIAIVGPPSMPGADVDYTFGQVAVDRISVSYRGNCGNISSAVGPFAVEEGMVSQSGGRASVRIHNTNTGKIIRAEFELVDGMPAVEGDLGISGVAGTGAPIRLAFVDPGGATTGRLLPTGKAAEQLVLADRTLACSMVDAANPVVFVLASELGLAGGETPNQIGTDQALMAQLEDVRVAAAVRMGVADSEPEARTTTTNLPLVAILSAPVAGSNIQVRMISSGQPHRATPLTGALCLAVAARIQDSLVARVASPVSIGGPFLLAHPGGILGVDALVEGGVALEAVVYRTARRLMQGEVLVPERAFRT